MLPAALATSWSLWGDLGSQALLLRMEMGRGRGEPRQATASGSWRQGHPTVSGSGLWPWPVYRVRGGEEEPDEVLRETGHRKSLSTPLVD